MFQIPVILAVLSLLILWNNAFSINGPFCSQLSTIANIPGTLRKTRMFYRVTTQNTTNRYTTWSYKSHPKLGNRYIVSDQFKRNRYTYDKEGHNYYHAQWYFLPAKGHPGWHHLLTRGIPGDFAAWSYKDGENLSQNRYYLILDPSYAYTAENFPKLEYLFKPVKLGSSYVLKLKALPDAFISVCNVEEFKRSHRWYVFVMNDEAATDNYRHGGQYFVNTLFNFEPILENEETNLIGGEYLTKF